MVVIFYCVCVEFDFIGVLERVCIGFFMVMMFEFDMIGDSIWIDFIGEEV